MSALKSDSNQAFFDLLFNPRSITVVGASRNLESIGGQPIKFLQDKGFDGAIYPVNPKYDEVSGLTCYPDIAALPEAPDVAVVAVAAKLVPAVIEQLGDKGTPFAVVLSSGFAEIGEGGESQQKRMIELARSKGVTVIGPNCQGYMNIRTGTHVGFGAPYGQSYRSGIVSLASQSGAFGNSLVMTASEEGVGLNQYISTGNEAGTSSIDLFEYFLQDPETKVIAGYVEGLKDAHRLIDFGRRALDQRKPVVLWKVGSSEAGARAAASHTANLVGGGARYQTAFRQAGIIEAQDEVDMANCLKAFASGRIPHGRNVAVVTISGGAGIALADRCEQLDLKLPPLEDKIAADLDNLLPAFASVANPLDVTAGILASPGNFEEVLRTLANDPGIDMLTVCLAAASGIQAETFVDAIVNVSEEVSVPMLVAWNPPNESSEESIQRLIEASIPLYKSPVHCARGCGVLWEYAKSLQFFERRQTESVAVCRSSLKDAGLSGSLTEYDSKRLLANYGIPVTKEGLAHSSAEAVALTEKIPGKVVMKVQSRDIPHKTESGGIKIGVKGSDAVIAAFDEITRSVSRNVPNAQVDGILVQEMVSGATEVILGIVEDASFGPCLVFGLGGIYAEVLEDVTCRLTPLTRTDVEAMIRETKIFQILAGARGRPRADIDALIDVMLKLSAMAEDLKGSLHELDINPLFVLPEGQGVKVGDALARFHSHTNSKPQPKVA